MPSVLFVCRANRFRSPLAAALFKKALKASEVQGTWIVSSAGTWGISDLPALPSVLEAAKAYGLDLSAHRSARLDRELLLRFDLILVMEASQKEALQTEFSSLYEQIYLLSDVVERRIYDIPDSSSSRQAVIDVCADLDQLIQRGLTNICVLAIYLHNTRLSSMLYDR